MTDTIDPPTYSPDQANSVFSPINAEVAAARPKTSEAPKQPETPQPTQDAPQAKETPKEPEKKPQNRLEKLSTIKKEESKAEEKSANGTEKPNEQKPENEGVKHLREFYQTHKDKVAEYEKIKPEFELTKSELQKLKAAGLNEQERQEFQRYREMNAVEAVKNHPAFVQKFIAPIKDAGTRIEALGKNAKLDKTKMSALWDAVEIPDEFERDDAIRSIIKGTGADEDLAPEKYQALADRAVALANKLTEELWPAHDAELSKADQIQLAARNREAQDKQQMSQKEQQEMTKAHEQVLSILSQDKLKLLLDEPDLAIEGITMAEAMKDAKPADNAQDKAYEVLMGAAGPFLVAAYNKVLRENSELKRANIARNGSKPKVGDAKTATNEVKEPQVSADDVFKRRGANYLGG